MYEQYEVKPGFWRIPIGGGHTGTVSLVDGRFVASYPGGPIRTFDTLDDAGTWLQSNPG